MWWRPLEYRYSYQYCEGFWYSSLQITKKKRQGCTPWECSQYIFLNLWYIFIRLHGVTQQKIVILVEQLRNTSFSNLVLSQCTQLSINLILCQNMVIVQSSSVKFCYVTWSENEGHSRLFFSVFVRICRLVSSPDYQLLWLVLFVVFLARLSPRSRIF
jgi:hypothetical protein